MAFTRTFEYLAFNSNNAILFVSIQFRRNSVVYDTVGSFPIQLPVDLQGRVPTEPALTSYINQVLDVVYSPESHQYRRNLADFGGTVSNADEILAFTPSQVRGIIYDEFNGPVEGASVQSLASGPSGAVITNSAGEYLLPANANFESVSVSTGQASFEIWPRQQTTAIFGITTLDIIVRDAASYGSNITITDADTQQNTVVNTSRPFDSAEVVLAVGSVVDSNGNPVSDVIVSIANSVVDDPNYASAFPGFFLGTSGPGTPFPIESFGFLEVRLSPLSGNEVLSLDPTKPATIRIPVSPDPVGVNTIPLWRLDEATGIWEEIGEATRVGSTSVFEATVTSFSFYNLDLPFGSVATLTISAYDNASLNDFSESPIPAPGVSVTADVTLFNNGGVWQGRGSTGANGQLVLSAPAGELNVGGTKGNNTYYGHSFVLDGLTASVNLFTFPPEAFDGSTLDDSSLSPPLSPPLLAESIQLIIAEGNNYSTPTTLLIVVDASELIEVFQFGNLIISGQPVSVVGIEGNTIELADAVVLTNEEGGEPAGATITFLPIPS